MPDPSDVFENERRQAILRDIEKRRSLDGPHVARAHPDRARQFMPFAALKGYGELVRDREEEVKDPTRLEFEDYA